MSCNTSGYQIIESLLEPDGSISSFFDPVCYNRLAVHRFMAKGQNTKDEDYCDIKIVNWHWAIYYGSSEAEHETEANIVQMNKSLKGESWKGGTWEIDGAGYKYIAVPTIYSVPVTIKEKETSFGLAVASNDEGYSDGQDDIYSYKEMILMNVNGVSQAYRVYRSTNYLNSPINLLIT